MSIFICTDWQNDVLQPTKTALATMLWKVSVCVQYVLWAKTLHSLFYRITKKTPKTNHLTGNKALPVCVLSLHLHQLHSHVLFLPPAVFIHVISQSIHLCLLNHL